MAFRVPLFLRALARRPLTRVAYALTRQAAWWTPATDGPACRASAHEALEVATSPAAVRATLQEAAQGPGEESYRPRRALEVLRHARVLSPALLHWAIDLTQGRPECATHLLSNPALTPEARRVAQDLLEERLWRLRQGLRLEAQLPGAVRGVTDSPAAGDASLAWLLLQAGAPPRRWSRFLIATVRGQIAGNYPLAMALADAPHVPSPLLAALRARLSDARPSAAADLLARLGRRTPCPLSGDDARTLLYRCYEQRREEDIPLFFAAMPRPLQVATWRIAFDTDPASTVLILAHAEIGAWPGLVLAQLEPLLTAADAAVRLAAIQLMSGVPLPPPARVSPPAPPRTTPDTEAPSLLQGLADRAGQARRGRRP